MRLPDFLQCGCGAPWPEETMQPLSAGVPVGQPASAPSNSSRRRRVVGATSKVLTPWRPSLEVISENGSPVTVTTAAAARDGKATAGGAAKAKAGVSRRVLPRAHSDDGRYKDVSLIVPAFSPTAYLF